MSTDYSDSPGASEVRSAYNLNQAASDDVEEIPRPTGSKKAKAQKAGVSSGPSHIEVGQQMVDQMNRFNIRYQERMDWKRTKEEIELLGIDLDTLPLAQRFLVEKQQNEIKARHGIP